MDRVVGQDHGLAECFRLLHDRTPSFEARRLDHRLRRPNQRHLLGTRERAQNLHLGLDPKLSNL